MQTTLIKNAGNGPTMFEIDVYKRQVTSYLEKYQNGEDVDSSELGKDAVKYEHCVEWLEKKLSLIHI